MGTERVEGGRKERGQHQLQGLRAQGGGLVAIILTLGGGALSTPEGGTQGRKGFMKGAIFGTECRREGQHQPQGLCAQGGGLVDSV